MSADGYVWIHVYIYSYIRYIYLHNSYGKEAARRDILADGWMWTHGQLDGWKLSKPSTFIVV